MTAQPPQPSGWYPDPAGHGTRYWDGSYWSSDVRPKRRSFAAASSHLLSGIVLTAVGVFFFFALLGSLTQGPSSAGSFITTLLLALMLPLGIYLLRGRGPSTRSVVARMEEARSAEYRAEMQRRAEQEAAAQHGGAEAIAEAVAGAVAAATAALAAVDEAEASEAQRRALADPDTAKALQNLQNLLYTRTISDAEFESAKKKLLG